jgi:hypothetical protein
MPVSESLSVYCLTFKVSLMTFLNSHIKRAVFVGLGLLMVGASLPTMATAQPAKQESKCNAARAASHPMLCDAFTSLLRVRGELQKGDDAHENLHDRNNQDTQSDRASRAARLKALQEVNQAIQDTVRAIQSDRR